MKRFKDRDLTSKITFIITCILILPTTIIGAFYYYINYNSLLEEADHSLQKEFASISSNMEDNLDKAENVMSEIAYSQELLYFLDEQNHLSEREIKIFLDDIQTKLMLKMKMI
ncbi:MAG: hypothetical protein LBN22_05095 [Clostridiales Family XIII bacterium]|jgi:sensor domain CHASE-containing protein|nr:hypothetical protein [Clostridiales Family XIII bacterium]